MDAECKVEDLVISFQAQQKNNGIDCMLCIIIILSIMFVCYLMLLSVSRLYSVNDEMNTECVAVGGIRTDLTWD
jgi:small neutral amino acid transporter SnatA (MarC family)